MIVELVFIL